MSLDLSAEELIEKNARCLPTTLTVLGQLRPSRVMSTHASCFAGAG
jgi:hypothetical protein